MAESTESQKLGTTYFARLCDAGNAVIRGDYRAAAGMFDLTRETNMPDDAKDLAEVFGLMTVKVEAREFALERALVEVQRKNADLERAAQLRDEFSKVLSGTIILLCFYSMTLAFLKSVANVDLGPMSMASYLMNLGLFVMLYGLIAWFLLSHKYPMSSFGLNLVHWKRAVAESVAATVLALLSLAGLKFYLVNHVAAFAGERIIDWSSWGPWQMWFVYLPASFAQELSTRGFQQTCIERLLSGKYRTTIAVVLTSAQFAVVHLHYSFATGILAFVGALLFGALYARHRTVAGVTVAHYILGQFVFGPLRLIR